MSEASDGQRKLDLGGFAFSFSAPVAAPVDLRPPPPTPAALDGEPWFVVENFLPEPLADQIVESFIAHEAAFTAAGVVGQVSEYRQALEIPPRLPVFRPFQAWLHRVLPGVRVRLGLADIPIALVDMAGNAYPNGGLFKKHFDNAAAVNRSRVFSYVYYLHRRPKGFHGGDLVMYPAKGMLVEEPLAVIPPTHNSIVFFRSDILHEVLPVVVPSADFADCRFTINGWAHR